MKRLLTLVMTLGLTVSFAYAHGGMEHVMGTIASINDSSITVTTADGKSQTVLLTADTKYARNDTVISLRDIKAGDHVVIHATRKDNKLTAATVKVGVRHMQGDMGSMKMDSSTESQQPK